MAADLITLAEGALLTQFLTPTAKHYGEVALKRVQHLGERAKLLLASVGRKATPVEEKILFPLVEAASLETDETLMEMWAALLANAADPRTRMEITTSFVEILRQLGKAEVKIIQRLDENLQNQKAGKVPAIRLGSFASSLSMSEELFEVTVDNLLRLRLCELPPTKYEITRDGNLAQYDPSKEKVEFTMLGLAFLATITPPVS